MPERLIGPGRPAEACRICAGAGAAGTPAGVEMEATRLSATVSAAQAGQRLLAFAAKALPLNSALRSAAECKSALKQGKIALNGAVVPYDSGRARKLVEGDIVSVVHDPIEAALQRLRLGAPLEVLYDGADFGVVSKQSGLACHSPLPNAEFTAERALAAHLTTAPPHHSDSRR